jgi:hypothetical protein
MPKPDVAHFKLSHLQANTRTRLSSKPASRRRVAPVRGPRCALEDSHCVTECAMEVVDCSTYIARAQARCGAATKLHYT